MFVFFLMEQFIECLDIKKKKFARVFYEYHIWSIKLLWLI